MNKQGDDGIAWTDWTLQLVRFRSKATGRAMNWCQKISPGCASCYAERITRRFHGAQHSYTPSGRELVEPFLDRDALRELVTTRRRGMCFVEDMSDLFGEWVPDEWHDECFTAFAHSPLTIQVLTKRADRMRAYMTDPKTPLRVLAQRAMTRADCAIVGERVSQRWPLPNVRLGVSCEDQPRADERIPHLLATPAAVRFVSLEPLLGPIEMSPYWMRGKCAEPSCGAYAAQCECGAGLTRIDWAIIGGESGPKARPCDVAWVRSLRDQCRAAGVACFIKQLGSRAYDSEHLCGTWAPYDKRTPTKPDGDGGEMALGNLVLLKDGHGGDPAEWPDDLRVRELPEVTRG